MESPAVHVIIDERIDHRVAHGQPIERQVDVPYVLVWDDLVVDELVDKETVVG